YLLCGIAAGVVHCLTNPNSPIPTVGASGAIAGVMGAYLFLFPQARVIVLLLLLIFPFYFEMPAVIFLAYWALAQVLSGFFSMMSASEVGGIAWWAHVGGFLTGGILQFFFVKRGDAYRRPFRDEHETEAAWVPARYWRSYR